VCIATEAALKYLDTDGSEIDTGSDAYQGEQPKATKLLMGKLWLSVTSINAQVVVKPMPLERKPESS